MTYTDPVEPNGKRYVNRWTSYSPRLKRDVLLYNDVTYDFWSLIETDPLVQTFCERPLRIKQLIDGHIIESTFDMWIRYKNGNEYFFGLKYTAVAETKDPKKLDNKVQKLEAQRLWCDERGYNYTVQTDQNIRQNRILLANRKALIPYLKQHSIPVETDKHQVLKRLSSEPGSINELCKNTGLPLSRIYETLAHLYVSGEVKCNFDRIPLGYDTEVWINGN